MAKQESCLLIMVKMVLMVTLLLAGLIAGLFFLRDKLNEYFNRGENIPVPDFRGKHLVEVFKEKPADLIIEKRDEKFDPLVPKDHVIAQYPEPGIRVKPNKKILLTISLGTKQVNVPDLVEKNQREVTLALINNQLREGNRAYIVSSRYSREKVITQSPLPNSPHQIQGGVDLLISLGGSSSRAPLPNFLGKGVIEAKATLQALGLTIGKVVTKKDPSKTRDTVIMTRPGPYDPVTENATVDLLVSSGLDNGTASVEDLKRFETVEGPLPANTPPAPPSPKPVPAATATPMVKLPPQTVPTNDPPPQILPPESPDADLPDALADVPATDDEEEPEAPPAQTGASKPAGPQALVSFVMPDGFMQKEVKFILLSPEGRQEVYSGVHKPLDLVKVKVPKSGQGKIQIYINDIFIEERGL